MIASSIERFIYSDAILFHARNRGVKVMANINIHNIESIEVDGVIRLGTGAYTRTITVRSMQGHFDIVLFSGHHNALSVVEAEHRTQA